ncbi:hypothetical protein CFU_0191 [Collimonas fungivorans Ter331]|uniref:Uncharacterized protein n=1 Tax=Collimonas fungivorans (strain Ter331) TaxID=1005048 RepID=G0AHJ0_COLFT|nr:hypothetical protein CFU_0191 [Collimonas fungivorans Ter331]
MARKRVEVFMVSQWWICFTGLLALKLAGYMQ